MTNKRYIMGLAS